MGLLSSIGSALTSAAKAVYNSPVGSVLNFTTAATAHPIQAVKAVATGTVKQFENTFYSQPLTKQITQIVTTTTVEAAAVVGIGAISSAAKAGTLATSASKLIPATTKGKVIAAVASPVILGAVVSQPAKTLSAIANTPSALTNVGGNLGNLIASPSVETAKTLFTENPVIVGGAVAAATLAGVKGIIPAIASAQQTSAIKEQTKAIEASTGMLVTSTPTQDTITIPAQNNNPIPQTPQTKTISATKIGAKRRRKAIVKPQNISQRVSVLVNNDNRHATKNYIKREVLIH